MSRSPEYRQVNRRKLEESDDEAYVADLFVRYLERSPDPAGLRHYTALLRSGRKRTRILADISNSREARVKRTFWFELELLLADELADRHWAARWIGRARRRERQRNRMTEVLCQRSIVPLSVSMGESAASGATLRTSQRPVVQSYGDTRNLGRNARRLLARVSLLRGAAF
ncbi:DUF4214 domain-containing protein [Sphingobium bisphenolivorans]|uniref:DUF4214 domain-containing protein n=1 Tax=Sphingobium bisphenolivorans TaxID=1335760 RepID=UPI003B75B735